MLKVSVESCSRLCQGDILRDVAYVEKATEYDGVVEVHKILFPLAIVLTQDCDLAQDDIFRNAAHQTQDKWLISVLLAPIYNAEHVFAGQHLFEIGIASQPIKRNRTDGQRLIQNRNPRYHYLEFPSEVEIVPSVVDFKHYFACSVTYLVDVKKSGGCVCRVSELYREDISQRFSAFLSRIGLPSFTDTRESEDQPAK